MPEKPIIFRAEMVRAILDGRKTQTRLIMEPQPVIDAAIGKPPYNVGDVLWVREAWRIVDWTEHGEPYVRYEADDEIRLCEVPADDVDRVNEIWEILSDPDNTEIDGKAADRRFRRAMFMFRWASRIDLRVTAIRSERLQDITESDAKAEGAMEYSQSKLLDNEQTMEKWCRMSASIANRRGLPRPKTATPEGAFACLWQSIHGPDAWAANPVVWVIEFERITKAGEQ